LIQSTETAEDYSRAAFDRYLELLGINRSGPGLDALVELTSQHLRRIPFENVSKIHRVKVLGIRGIPGLDEYLDGIEQYNFGGTCYTNNYYMHLLLAHLGYAVRLCGADVDFTGAPLDNHMVNVVTIDGHEFVVDVGFGTPFLKPFPRNESTDVVLEYGPDKYVLKPVDSEGRSRLEVIHDGRPVHGYLLKPAARQVGYFRDVVTRSYTDMASFLHRLMIARFIDDEHYVLRNNSLTISTPDSFRKLKYETRRDIADAAARYYRMPLSIVTEVIDFLSDEDLFG